jgi:hypothetical protein
VNGTDETVTGNFITFTIAGGSAPLPHGLGDGSTITYRGSCCSLQDGRTYGVLLKDPNSIQLGARFEGVQVDPSTDIIAFGTTGQVIIGTDGNGDNIYAPAFLPSDHNLLDGDIVYYFSRRRRDRRPHQRQPLPRDGRRPYRIRLLPSASRRRRSASTAARASTMVWAARPVPRTR